MKHITIALLVCGAVLATAAMSCRNEHHAQSITNVDNLHASGSADIVGETIARSGVRLAAPSTGPTLLSGTGNPNGSVTATKGSTWIRTDTAGIYQNTDGAQAWSQVGGGGAGSPSLSTPTVTTAALTSTQCDGNITSLATRDWLVFLGGSGAWTITGFPTTSSNLIHRRRLGGRRLLDAISFVGSNAITTVGYAKPAVTATDSIAVNNGSMSMSGFVVTWSGNNTGGGFAIDLPMYANETGTLKLCMFHASMTLTVTASFADASVSNTTLSIPNFDPAGGARGMDLISFPFTNGSAGGNRLRITVVEATSGSPFTGEMGLAYVYL